MCLNDTFIVNRDMFGKYVKIPHTLAGPKRKFIFKVVGRFKSNTYCDVPISPLSNPVSHYKNIKELNDLEDVLNVIQCGIDETKVLTVALKDCELVEPRTNADRIRNMNNDELNDMLNSIGDGDLLCHYMGKEPSNSCSNPNQDACYLCVKKWLESEV